MGKLYTTDGEILEVKPLKGRRFTKQELQLAVEGPAACSSNRPELFYHIWGGNGDRNPHAEALGMGRIIGQVFDVRPEGIYRQKKTVA